MFYNPARDDEAVVTNRFVVANHKGVGDTVYVDLPSAKQLASAADGTEPTKLTGPRIKLTIVGVIRAPWSLSFDLGGGPGGIQMSPGVVQRYPASTLGNQHNPGNPNYVNALVRLRGGGGRPASAAPATLPGSPAATTSKSPTWSRSTGMSSIRSRSRHGAWWHSAPQHSWQAFF